MDVVVRGTEGVLQRRITNGSISRRRNRECVVIFWRMTFRYLKEEVRLRFRADKKKGWVRIPVLILSKCHRAMRPIKQEILLLGLHIACMMYGYTRVDI